MAHEHQSSSFSQAMGTLGAMIFGATIGAIVALLMAPKSGVELRRDLKQGANQMSERVSEASQEVVDSVREKVSQIGRQAEKLGDKAESMGDRAKRAAEDISEGSTGV